MPSSKITVCLNEPIATIRPELHGHFAEHLGTCVNQGLWVGESSSIPNTGGIRTDVLEALRRLNIPLLRWPGGCFADDYHWEDGVGPRRDRPRRVNLWWGSDIEDNAFGTHEFITLCRYLGAQPYLAGNLGSGTPREMRNWMEYCNFAGGSTLARRRAENGSPQPFNVRYWGVGNEAWGCGGSMCPEDYAGFYKRYATYLGGFGTPPYLIAVGPDGHRPDWTRRFFTKLSGQDKLSTYVNFQLHGFAAHYYCGTAGTATEYSTDQWYELLQKAAFVETLIVEQRTVMDEFDPQRKIDLLVDEWGTWHPPTPGKNPAHLWQQNTIRDALVAAITLDTFNRHADKVKVANIAQVVNVLQAMVLTEEDRMLLTPTFHVFDMHQHHREGMSVRTEIESPIIRFIVGNERRQMPQLSGSASIHGRALVLSITNAHATLPADVSIELRGAAARTAKVSVLAHEDITAHNTFDHPNVVAPMHQTTEINADWRHTFPPASVTVMQVALD